MSLGRIAAKADSCACTPSWMSVSYLNHVDVQNSVSGRHEAEVKQMEGGPEGPVDQERGEQVLLHFDGQLLQPRLLTPHEVPREETRHQARRPQHLIGQGLERHRRRGRGLVWKDSLIEPAVPGPTDRPVEHKPKKTRAPQARQVQSKGALVFGLHADHAPNQDSQKRIHPPLKNKGIEA